MFNCLKLYILLWKNFKIQIRQRCRTAKDIIFPLLVLALLNALVNDLKKITGEQKMLTSSNETSPLKLAWSPEGPVVQKIMNEVIKDLVSKNLTVSAKSFTSAASVNSFLSNSSTNVEAIGALFPDTYQSRKSLPKRIQLSLQSTVHRCSPRSFAGQNLIAVFNEISNNATRLCENQRLYKKKKLAVQDSIYKAIIKEQLKPEMYDLPVIKNKPMNKNYKDEYEEDRKYKPYQSKVYESQKGYNATNNSEDNLLDNVEIIAIVRFILPMVICFFIFLMFCPVCTHIITDLVVEKEKQLKELLKMLGFSNFLIWLSWYLKTMLMLIIPVIGVTIVLKKSIFSQCDFMALFVLNFLYVTSLICFAFLISTLFSRSATANLLGTFFLFIPAFLPIVEVQSALSFYQSHYSMKILRCLSCHWTFLYAYDFIFIRHRFPNTGVLWSDIFDTKGNTTLLSMGESMLLLMMDTAIYLLLALYLELVFPGNYGHRLPFYFFLLPTYWGINSGQNDVEEDLENVEDQNVIRETQPVNNNTVVSFINLRKVYGNSVAVHNLSLDLLENQITALLGANGAGKTTTMEMLTGMQRPTSGTIFIDGYDMRTNFNKARQALGYCPQHDILFTELTVQEHFYFYLMARGVVNEIDRRYEIDKYLNILQLDRKGNEIPANLSGGMRRKLSVSLACCGGTRIVLLDEPSAGLDPVARRSLWDLLLLKKTGRTILLSSHFMDEADILGDQIAILVSGKLKCVGSPLFLKKTYGDGYNLVIVKEKDCDVTEITKVLQKFIPSCRVLSNIGSELTYTLSNQNSDSFQKLFTELETKSKDLKIVSFGVSSAAMKDIFIKVASEEEEEEVTTYEVSERYIRDYRLLLQQYLASILKMMIVWRRNWKSTLAMHIVYLCFLYYAMDITVSKLKEYSAHPSEGQDNKSLIISNGNTKLEPEMRNIMNEYATMSTRLFSSRPRKYVHNRHATNIKELVNKVSRKMASVVIKDFVGATFKNNQITALFDDTVPSSLPYSQYLVYNAILKSLKGSAYVIQITVEENDNIAMEDSKIAMLLCSILSYIMAIETTRCIYFAIKENASGSKHLQIASGVPISTYWISMYVWNMITLLVTSLLIIIVMGSFKMTGWKTREGLDLLFSELVAFSLAMLSLVYLVSLFYSSPSRGFMAVFTLLLFSAMAASICAEYVLKIKNTHLMCSVQNCTTETIDNMRTEYFLNILPTFNIDNYIKKSIYVILSRQKAEGATRFSRHIFNKSYRSSESNELYNHLKEVLSGNIQILRIEALVLFITLLVVESYKHMRLSCWNFSKENRRDTSAEIADVIDGDVQAEKDKVHSLMSSDIDEYVVVLMDVSKKYKKFRAVKQLCLTIERGEAFGLLGVNGAGKSTLFKMMTGKLRISQGNAYLCGISLKSHIADAQKIMGYCPQEDALIENFTTKEMLAFYGLLRGVPYQESDQFTSSMAQDFNLMKHFKKKVYQLSGGNKRKLNVAISFMGETRILYLDEPTTGMDQIVKRIIWRNISNIRDSGKSIVLTTHSIEECEAICTKLGIMVNGEFICLGSQQHLKSKFNNGYTLMIKVESKASVHSVDEVKKFVLDKFPLAVLKSEGANLFTFFIPVDDKITWSKMFGIMEKSKNQLKIENYSLEQATLEDVFLQFCSKQRNT